MSLVSNSLHKVPTQKIWSHGKGPNVKKLQQFNALNVRGLKLDSAGPNTDSISPRSGKGGPVQPGTIDTFTRSTASSSDVLNHMEAWNLSMGGH